MMRVMLKSKISSPRITQTELYYKGSITIDETLMRAANLYEGERVDVLNLNNGARLQTYVIKGLANSGVICLNGPAARSGVAGDMIVVVAYGLFDERECEDLQVNYVEVDEQNKIKNSYLA